MFCLLALAVVPLIPSATASKSGCATVSVVDSTGSHVSGAIVTINDSSGITIANGATPNSGRVSLACGLLASGASYTTRAEKSGMSANGGATADQKGSFFIQLQLPL